MAMQTSLQDDRSEQVLNELEPESNREIAIV